LFWNFNKIILFMKINVLILQERKRLKERYPSNLLSINDREQCSVALNCYAELLSNRDICEGRCPKGENCPTGLSIINLSKINLSNTESSTAIASTSHFKSTFNSTLSKTESQDKSKPNNANVAYFLDFQTEKWEK